MPDLIARSPYQSDSEFIKLWHRSTGGDAAGDCIATLSGHRLAVNALDVGTDSQTLISASSDTTLSFEWAYPNRANGISASWDKTLKLWNLDTGTEVDCLSGHTDSVTCFALALDLTLISGSQDKTKNDQDMVVATDRMNRTNRKWGRLRRLETGSGWDVNQFE